MTTYCTQQDPKLQQEAMAALSAEIKALEHLRLARIRQLRLMQKQREQQALDKTEENG